MKSWNVLNLIPSLAESLIVARSPRAKPAFLQPTETAICVFLSLNIPPRIGIGMSRDRAKFNAVSTHIAFRIIRRSSEDRIIHISIHE